MPFELTTSMHVPNGPTITRYDTRGGKVYDKTVAVGWSGENDWAQFLNALGTFGLAMQDADEVHIFAGMAQPPERSKFSSADDYEIAYKRYQLRNDYERVKNNSTDFRDFHALNNLPIKKHHADSASLIKLLEGLYQEAVSGKKIQLTMMVSNHGIFVVDTKTFEMQGAGSRISEQDLAYIGRLMAPLDTTIVNGTCFGTDHVDLISQHMMQHRDHLIQREDKVDLLDVCSSSITRALMGRPAFGTKSAFEADLFSGMNWGKSTLDAFLGTANGEVIGHAKMGMGGDPWATNLPLSSSDKLFFYLRAIYADRDLKSGKLDSATLPPNAVSSNFIDEGDPKVFAHQFDTTFVDLSGIGHLGALTASIMENQRAVEAQIDEIGLPGLENFSFSDQSRGKQYADTIVQALSKGERVGLGGSYADTEIERLVTKRAILQKYMLDFAEAQATKDKIEVLRYEGEQFSSKKSIASRDGKPVKYLPDAMKEVDAQIATLTTGNDAHKWKYAAAMIGRHLMAAQRLTDPAKFPADGGMSRLQQIYVAYRHAELRPLIPETFTVEGEDGRGVQRSILRPIHRVPGYRPAQRPASSRPGAGTQ